MVPARIPLLAAGNPSNYLLDLGPGSREWSVSSDGGALASGQAACWGELVTPHGHQPRPSKHTIRVGEQRRDQREREREMQLQWGGPGLLLGHWASASLHKARPGTQTWDNLQICPWQNVITDTDTRQEHQTRVKVRCSDLWSTGLHQAVLGLAGHDWDSGPAPLAGPSLQRLPWTEPRSEPVTRWGPSWHVKFKVHNSHSQISNIVRCTLIVVRIQLTFNTYETPE